MTVSVGRMIVIIRGETRNNEVSGIEIGPKLTNLVKQELYIVLGGDGQSIEARIRWQQGRMSGV